MNVKTFIDRPILSGVISVAILLLGFLGLCAIARFREKPLFAFLSLLGLLVVCYYLARGSLTLLSRS